MATLKPWLMAVVFVGAAVAIQLVAWPYILPTPYLLLFPAVMAASRYGGLGPGLLATAIGVVVADYVFLPPSYAWSFAPDHVFSLLLFAANSTFISILASDLRHSHAALRDANRDLESRVAERTRDLEAARCELEAFSYSVSHDLRAPLRAIGGFERLLEEELGEARRPKVDMLLGRIRAAVERMAALIDDLLALSHVSRAPLTRERVDVSAAAREVLAELAHDQPERRVETTVEDGIVVRGDPSLVRIVLENLLSNAWKFTGRTPDAHITVSRVVEPGGAGFRVKDDGVGFDPTLRDKLFQPFERLHPRSEFEGTGIGLALVRRIVERHAGKVEAEGAPDQGAAFTVVVPG